MTLSDSHNKRYRGPTENWRIEFGNLVSPYSKIQEGGGLQIVIFAYTKRDALGVL
jgi:hypothetical protein